MTHKVRGKETNVFKYRKVDIVVYSDWLTFFAPTSISKATFL